MLDREIVVDAMEEAQRILAEYVIASPRRNQDEILNMLLFILCRGDVEAAVAHEVWMWIATIQVN